MSVSVPFSEKFTFENECSHFLCLQTLHSKCGARYVDVNRWPDRKSDVKRNLDSCYVSSMECDLMDRSQIFFSNRKSTLVFCFDNCAAKSSDKFVLVWLKCCPSYRSRKKGIEGKFFEAEAVGRGWEMFPRFPFFYWGNLDNTEIRRGPNLYERRGKHNYWNRILFSFVWLFRGITIVIWVENDGKSFKVKILKILLTFKVSRRSTENSRPLACYFPISRPEYLSVLTNFV